MDANRMPGDAEALAAIAGMAETYGRSVEHAVGDSLTFRLVGWEAPRVGRVEGVATDGDGYIVASGGMSWFVTEAEILRV